MSAGNGGERVDGGAALQKSSTTGTIRGVHDSIVTRLGQGGVCGKPPAIAGCRQSPYTRR
jgi:hypothetical protein